MLSMFCFHVCKLTLLTILFNIILKLHDCKCVQFTWNPWRFVCHWMSTHSMHTFIWMNVRESNHFALNAQRTAIFTQSSMTISGEEWTYFNSDKKTRVASDVLKFWIEHFKPLVECQRWQFVRITEYFHFYCMRFYRLAGINNNNMSHESPVTFSVNMTHKSTT